MYADFHKQMEDLALEYRMRIVDRESVPSTMVFVNVMTIMGLATIIGLACSGAREDEEESRETREGIERRWERLQKERARKKETRGGE